ncbi:MAG: flavodoxin-dependent (E)-4-hydroxy-3-methylbut-2-enyl-diphosphate synthase [Oscillospiraceae bacterium]|jgi:(E)-4-hydroxy-3-methylbut-2-enyl-diphosphate synthase|nr:flavodoxin-dependent (E)-4-hydroxy-3-methylbut-2-enyl-diphosphate synthase [Oscillospiraceae bacterium]
MDERQSRAVFAGGVQIGGGAAACVQSMLSTPAGDIPASVAQAKRLHEAGCEILRAAVPTRADVALIAALKAAVPIPIVADIHFDYRIALDCVAAGVDKIRLNPGNIGSADRVAAVAQACKARGIPIRIGVNAGSLEKDVLARFGGVCPEALVASALEHAALLEACDFHDIVLSLKASDVRTMVAAYRLAAAACDYPLHLGVTEAGTARQGCIKSAAGIGALLLDGIGDTIRVSFTEDPVEEIRAGLDILRALGLRRDRAQIVSCPTCGRTKIDLIALTRQVEAALADCHKPITVAVMGCAVNGPGEAREADVGLAGGDGCALLFSRGEILRKVPEEQAVEALLKEIDKLCIR